MAFAILRTKKLTLADLPQASAHNQRDVQPVNADPAMTPYNIDYLVADKRTVRERWEARMAECGNPGVRKNAVAAIELLMGYSPEATWIDADQWGKDCAEFAERVFGRTNVISTVQHRDEKTIHNSTISIPLILKPIRGSEPKWRLAASEWLDGREKLEALQTRFWAEVGTKHGLKRGEKGSARDHVPQKVLYAESHRVDNAINDAVHTAPAIEPHESKGAYDDRLKAHLVQRLAMLAEAAKQGMLAREANRVATQQANGRREETERRKRAEAGRDKSLKELAQYRAEQQARLRDLPVAQVLEKILGVRPLLEGSARVFVTPELKIVVAQDDWRFAVYKGDARGGSGAISAVMQAANLPFRDAVRWLSAHFSSSEVESAVRSAYEPQIRQVTSNGAANPARLLDQIERFAPTVEDNWLAVRQYLVRSRCLPAAWIDSLHRRNRLWANQMKSACFGHWDDKGVIVGVSVRGTTGNFKQTLGDKNVVFFRLRPGRDPLRQIVVVESPIEAISLAAFERDRSRIYASTAGAGGVKTILEYAKKYALAVIAAQNLDAAGDVQAAITNDEADRLNLACERQLPPFQDWNDTLRFVVNEMRSMSHNASTNADRLRAAWHQEIHTQRLKRKTTPADYLPAAESIPSHETIISI